MKKFSLLMLGAVAALSTSCGNSNEEIIEEPVAEPVKYSLDVEASSLEWTGRKNVAEYKHVGNIKFSKGSVETLEDIITSGSFSIDMNSITTTDEVLPEDKKQMLNGHLKAPDFFDVAKYPTTEVTVGELKDGKLPTTITLMGVEFKKDLPVKTNVSGDKLTVTGTFDVDFSGLKSVGFMADPKTGEQILSVFSYKLNLVLTK